MTRFDSVRSILSAPASGSERPAPRRLTWKSRREPDRSGAPRAPFEVDHTPELGTKCAERVWLEYHRFEVLAEKLLPRLERAGKITAVPAREQSGKGRLCGQHEFEDMDMPVVGEQRLQVGQDAAGAGPVDVVEEAVHQNKVEALPNHGIFCDVGH